ncbi:glycosyltransferase family 2 protein [Olsenella intestinalis]|uniref:glycosyltransferase family 2 protein n=1 Tax=Olsenella intestinalis TaxID=2930083 RepID=UPI00200EB232|nr:glycosyltransferase [Olsenella intestinalis]
MGRINLVGMCRGEGHGYALLSSMDTSLTPVVRAHTADGRAIPCKLVCDGCRETLPVAGERTWVAVFPLVDCDVDLSVFARGEQGQALLDIPFHVMPSKVASRLLTRRKPELAGFMRGIERRRPSAASPLVVSGAWRMGAGDVVWRVHVRFANPCEFVSPRIVACDMGAREISSEFMVLEDQVVPDGTDSDTVREVTFSMRLPADVEYFYFATSLGADDVNADFKVIMPKDLGEFWRDFGRYPAGAADSWCYEGWLMQERVAPARAVERRDSVSLAPKISVVLATTSEVSRETVASLSAQTYARWELLIVGDHEPSVAREVAIAGARGVLSTAEGDSVSEGEDRLRLLVREGCASVSALEQAALEKATGDYVCFLDDGVVLEPDALECLAQLVDAGERVDLAYCDEDVLEGGHLLRPQLKCGPNLGKLRAYDYLGSLSLMSRRLVDEMGALPEDLDAARAYWRHLRAFELTGGIDHVCRVLAHVPAHTFDADELEAQKHALEGHLERMGAAATVEPGPAAGTWRVRYALLGKAPRVSVIIPNKDHLELLRPCLESILEKTTYPDFEVVVVENNSEDEATFAYYDEVCAADARVRVTTWEPTGDVAFNYSAIVNHGAREATGELLLFLNNDTDVIAPGWIDEMVAALAQREDVAVVGAKLVFPDGLTQHAGMAHNPNGYFMHMGETTPADLLDHDYNVALPHDATMVTGACQMVRRSVFEELGGYDEELAVAFNDGDFCLRARDAGYEVTYTPWAELHHKEFSSRGREATDRRHQVRFLQEYAHLAGRHGERFAMGDPSINDCFSQWDAQFRLR